MFERYDLSRKTSKGELRKLYPPLAERLGELQRAGREKGLPVIVVFEGLDPLRSIGPIRRFMQPLDPRGFRYHNVGAPSPLDLQHPFLWRYWVRTPPRGQVAIFDRSWYGRALADERDEQRRLDEVLRFERVLADDGFLFLKFFLLTAPGRRGGDGPDACGLTADDRSLGERIGPSRFERAVELTDRPHAPWTVVEAEDEEHAVIKVLRTAVERLEQALATAPGDSAAPPLPSGASPRAGIDLSLKVKDRAYEEQLEGLQARLRERQCELVRERRSLVVVFEGRDAAGKGGAIARLAQALNPRTSRVVPVYAPTAAEKAHHYLWRFHRALPSRGHIALFDRSWYGRVLVERVEGLATPSEWSRAYREIKEFERSLVDDGATVVKLWLEVDRQTQLKRFVDRAEDPRKAWKITADDWRSRERWDEYSQAVDEMLVRTAAPHAPWTVVEGNDKNYARLKTLRTVLAATER